MGPTSRRRARLAVLGFALTVAAAAPAPAGAAAWRCEAAAVTGSALNGAVALPAVRVGAGAADCANATAGSGLKLPSPLDSTVLVAQTAVTGAAGNPALQQILAVGGIADLRVKALPTLPVQLPAIEIPAALRTLTVTVPAVPNPVPALPPLLPAQTLTLDVGPALDALEPERLLPSLDLLRVQGAVAYAAAGCLDGAPKLAGASQVAGISVLGADLPAGQFVDRALTLLDSGSIDPSAVDLTKITLPAGLSLDLPIVGPVLLTAIRGALDALPTIAIPATLAQVKVTPGEQTIAGGLLTQRALRVQVGIAGQSIVDATVGEATVGAGSVDCAAAVENPALACTNKNLVLVDVFERKGRVQLLGAADRKLAGRTVDIVFAATGKVVARAKVARDGSFASTAPLPAARLRGDDARYMAVLGKERSMNLKLDRRMIVDEMVARDGRVLISGRVSGLMATGADRTITVTRRVSCTKMEKVTSFRPESDGTFSVAFDAPADTRTAVYRLSTRVRKSSRNRKTFPTFTLPRAVNLTR
jgi:hypothetical protein